MMKINYLMREILVNVDFSVEIDNELNSMARQGFVIKNNCYFICSLLPRNTNAVINNFPDKTGCECFFNSIHIEDYSNENTLVQAIKFINEIFVEWRRKFKNISLVGILSVDDFSVVVKFHVRRDHEEWLSDDFDTYETAIMQLETTDVFPFF